MDKQYYFCIACGEYVFRLPGMRYGDGQVDSDDNPVYLLADVNDMTDADMDNAHDSQILCGCNC